MRQRLKVDVLLDDRVRLGEPGGEVAILPLVTGLGVHRDLARRHPGHVGLGPLDVAQLAPDHRVGVGPRVRPARTQAIERVEDELHRFEVDADALDRFGRRLLVDRRHRENRLALVERLVGQGGLVRRLDVVRQLVGRQDAFEAGERLGRAAVDRPHPRMGHRADQQLAEDHAFGTMVLRILGTPGDLRVEIRCLVVLPEQFVISHVRPPA